MNIVLQADCLEVLRELPDDCVDLVITSPPYEDARLYAELNYKVKGQEWVDWAVERYVECVRVCKGLVVWVVEGKTRQFRWSATPALLMADLHRVGVKLRKPPIYHRISVSGSGGPDWWRNDYEFCVCASKGKLPWSNNTATGKPPKWPVGGEMSNRTQDGRRRSAKTGSRLKSARPMPKISNPGNVVFVEREDGELEPGNVIRCKVGGGQMGSKLAHENEAPFPDKLVDPFVQCFCPPGGLVLDPFCGSGTSLAVALRHGRQYFGIDQRQSQVDLSERRIEEEKQSLGLASKASCDILEVTSN